MDELIVYLVMVKEIEMRSGLDFPWELEDVLEEGIETSSVF